MRRFFAVVLSLAMFTRSLLLGQEDAKPKRKKVVHKTAVEERLEKLQQRMEEQQSQIQQQQSQIQQQQSQIQLLQQSSATEAQQNAQVQANLQQASQQAASAQQAASNLSASVADLKSGEANLTQSFQASDKAIKALESPTALHFRGVTITPGGWAESTFLFRTRNENADITSSLAGTPLDGTPNSKLTEFRGSARGTRLTMLVEGKAGSTKLTGYYEIDFLGQAPTANQVQTNSFNPRQRQLFGQAEFNNGWMLDAGQFWSLVTTDRKGLMPRSEFIPTTIEGSYIIGYTYARQNAVRLTKNFDNKVWAAFEVANPETNQPSTSYTPENIFGFNNSANDAGVNGSTLNYLAGSTNGFSTNLAPDLLAKAVFEPGWGHFEIKALGRAFRDRIGGNNLVSYGGGLGWGMVLAAVPKKIDVIFEGLGGAGIGRYGASNGPDVTIRPDGKIIPLHALHTLAGVETHLHPKLDWYVYAGDEYYGRSAFVNPTSALKPAGYGSSLVNNKYCEYEIVPSGGAACGAQTRNVWDVSTGFWYRIYKGPVGTFQYGVQYAHLYRGMWSGVGGAPAGTENVIDTSFRFYLP